MPKPAPTLRSLAAALGLSRTTVSDALRGSTRVDVATAERVREGARLAGYRRNPLAGALMSELRRSRGMTFRGVLAALDLDETERPGNASRYHRELVLGAEARASDLGFKLERFVVGQAGLSVPRLDTILQSRGIYGLLLLPAWEDPDLSKLDWTRYAGVYLDYIIERPALHAVCPDHYRSMVSALQRLHALGYRRPGVVLQRHMDERLQHRWSAAFRSFEATHALRDPVAPLIAETVTREGFTRWFREHRPDVVLAHDSETIAWIEAAGGAVPARQGFLCLNVLAQTRPCAGLDLQPRVLGARGVELLIAQIQRNETGIPEWPSTTSIPALWHAGPTIRAG